ncbi:MAG TPA: hypothetical protein DEH78_17845 [Solibacterales bacterium]|nr:hypothetical protein [Bryobacterales bacterium]
MDLFELGNQLLGGGGQGTSQGSNIVGEVLGMIQGQPGGLGGLVSAFQKGGLGDVVNSWVGVGQNLPISPEQLQGVLGSDAIGGLASKLGLSPEAAGSQLSQLLPTLIDQLTPNGQMPAAGNLLELGAGLLKGFLPNR